MKNIFVASVLAVFFIAFISSCKKETEGEISEPITLVAPDTSLIYKKAGEKQNYTISFVTDRGINYAQALYEIDTLDSINHVYTYPDTLFYENFDSAGKTLTNKHVYFGSYTVPDSTKVGSRIKFKTSFKAQDLMYHKEFSIKVTQ
jgi:hypothetical protein